MDERARKRSLGQIFTIKNPFCDNEPFAKWLEAAGDQDEVVEPFAGDGALIRMLPEIRSWVPYDIEPRGEFIIQHDSLAAFPRQRDGARYRICITNPPWLSRASARARGLPYPSTARGNLAFHALDLCLTADYVCAILPRSFLSIAHRYNRLLSVVLFGSGMFDGTEEPCVVALFGPESQKFYDIWENGTFVGRGNESQLTSSGGEALQWFHFNVADGEIGLKAFDGRVGSRAMFVRGDAIHSNAIKGSSRHYTRIRVHYTLSPSEIEEFIRRANELLEALRIQTSDSCLTAIRGRRPDGGQRCRVPFKLARAILAEILEPYLASLG